MGADPISAVTPLDSPKRPSVAVVMRFKNHCATMRPTLAALTAQTHPPDQIIGVDTGSSDGSRELLLSHGARIVDWTQPYHVARTINAGVAACTTDLVLVLSAHSVLDDRETIARYVAAFADPACAGVSLRPPGYTRDLPDAITWSTVQERGLTYCSIYSNSHGMVRKSLWDEMPFDECFGCAGEDYCWALEQLRRGHHVVMLPIAYSYLKRDRRLHADFLYAVLTIGSRFRLPMGWLGVKRTTLALAWAIIRVVVSLGLSRQSRDDLAEHVGHMRGWWRWRRGQPLRLPR